MFKEKFSLTAAFIIASLIITGSPLSSACFDSVSEVVAAEKTKAVYHSGARWTATIMDSNDSDYKYDIMDIINGSDYITANGVRYNAKPGKTTKCTKNSATISFVSKSGGSIQVTFSGFKKIPSNGSGNLKVSAKGFKFKNAAYAKLIDLDRGYTYYNDKLKAKKGYCITSGLNSSAKCIFTPKKTGKYIFAYTGGRNQSWYPENARRSGPIVISKKRKIKTAYKLYAGKSYTCVTDSYTDNKKMAFGVFPINTPDKTINKTLDRALSKASK